MRIIEGLKKIKDLQRKADDLVVKVSKHSAYLDNETPVYADQKAQVAEWMQSHQDILKEILKLRIAIQTTNLATMVTIDELGATKSIAEWVHRRRDLAKQQAKMWASLTDRNLREGQVKQPSTEQVISVKIVRCYDPAQRDKLVELYTSEPTLIDGRLEIVNAVTDLIGA